MREKDNKSEAWAWLFLSLFANAYLSFSAGWTLAGWIFLGLIGVEFIVLTRR